MDTATFDAALASALPAELLQSAETLCADLQAVCEIHHVDLADVETAIGPLDATALLLTAAAWRRSGRLAAGTAARPIGPTSTSVRVLGPTVDARGTRTPGNEAAVLGLIRSVHADASLVGGLLTWSWVDGSGQRVVEVCVPGVDFAAREDGGAWRSVTPAAG